MVRTAGCLETWKWRRPPWRNYSPHLWSAKCQRKVPQCLSAVFACKHCHWRRRKCLKITRKGRIKCLIAQSLQQVPRSKCRHCCRTKCPRKCFSECLTRVWWSGKLLLWLTAIPHIRWRWIKQANNNHFRSTSCTSSLVQFYSSNTRGRNGVREKA